VLLLAAGSWVSCCIGLGTCDPARPLAWVGTAAAQVRVLLLRLFMRAATQFTAMAIDLAGQCSDTADQCVSLQRTPDECASAAAAAAGGFALRLLVLLVACSQPSSA
jgi:hypothetical protein